MTIRGLVRSTLIGVAFVALAGTALAATPSPLFDATPGATVVQESRQAALAELSRQQPWLAPLDAARLAYRLATARTLREVELARRELAAALDLQVRAGVDPAEAAASTLEPGPELAPLTPGAALESHALVGRPTFQPRQGRGVWMPSPDSD